MRATESSQEVEFDRRKKKHTPHERRKERKGRDHPTRARACIFSIHAYETCQEKRGTRLLHGDRRKSTVIRERAEEYDRIERSNGTIETGPRRRTQGREAGEYAGHRGQEAGTIDHDDGIEKVYTPLVFGMPGGERRQALRMRRGLVPCSGREAESLQGTVCRSVYLQLSKVLLSKPA